MKKKILFLTIMTLLCFLLFSSCEIIKDNQTDGNDPVEGNTNTPNDDTSNEATPSVGLELALDESNSAYTVLGIGECKDSDIIIPSEYNDLPVKSIDSGAFYKTSITSVVIPEGIETIKSHAFSYCKSLESITLPDSLTKIENDAFEYCTSLKEVAVPGGISELGNHIFYECSALEIVSLNKGIKEIAKGMFNECKALKTIILPEGITVISESAFSSCKSLEEIILPDSLERIESGAFYECNSLKEIILPDNVTYLGRSVFYECSVLENVKMSKNLTEFGDKIFYGCNMLKSIEIPKGITSIPNEAFRACSLTKLIIPNSVTSIGERAFYSCKSLTSLTIPASVEYIATDAFSYCSYLYEICNKSSVNIVNKKQNDTDVISDFTKNIIKDEKDTHIRNLDGYVFYDDGTTPILIKYVGEDKNIIMPDYGDGRKYIVVSNIFSAARDITALTLTDNIISLDLSGLSKCENLETITFNCLSAEIETLWAEPIKSVKTIYINADVNTKYTYLKELEAVVFGEGVTQVFNQAFYGLSIKSVTLSSTVKEIGTEAFGRCQSLSELIIPENSCLESIGSRALNETYKLKSLTLASGILTIGEEAFADSGISVIDLGSSLTLIGKNVFRRCSSLASITIPNSVVEIGDEAFTLCASLKEVKIDENSSLTTIGISAFARCDALATIVLPKSLENIGDNAFTSTNISAFKMDKENPYFTVVNGDILSKDGSIFVLHAPKSLMKTVIIKNTVKRIEAYAFAQCLTIKEIKFEAGSTLESIGERAFEGVYIEEIILPASLITIGDYAFNHCQSLNKVVFEEGSRIESIGNGAFYSSQFFEEIRIPISITSIGENAFAWTGIVNLYFDGTLEEWEKVEKGNNWNIPMGDYRHYHTIHCSDGIIENK